MSVLPIRSALISVFDKSNLDVLAQKLHQMGVQIYSTGGTQDFLEGLGIPVSRVEDLTDYPSILGGRVKTLHPKIFGGILAIRNDDHLAQLTQYEIPTIDLVIVDLYPFEKTLLDTDDHDTLIEKIDIGGISLIRAAAKNYEDVVIIPAQKAYQSLIAELDLQQGKTTLEFRKKMAVLAFETSSSYDSAIHQYLAFGRSIENPVQPIVRMGPAYGLRYGENPHQNAVYAGDLDEIFEFYGGKTLSYNNLIDIDAACQVISEFKGQAPTFAIIKHTNTCGLAQRDTVLDAWKSALSADPVSAFGGILISNAIIDAATALEIDQLFYEILIAPGFEPEALDILLQKKKRNILKIKEFQPQRQQVRSILNGHILQAADLVVWDDNDLKVVSKRTPTEVEMADLHFAYVAVKHLKSNTITLVKDKMLLGMGCGQTSRVDALRQAIEKSKSFGFDLTGAVMASDAFFPFPDCVEIAHEAGIRAVVHPGGSIKDQLSIDYCDSRDMAMVLTGIRHFKH